MQRPELEQVLADAREDAKILKSHSHKAQGESIERARQDSNLRPSGNGGIEERRNLDVARTSASVFRRKFPETSPETPAQCAAKLQARFPQYSRPAAPRRAAGD